ncbi:hypothetical protein [Marinitoga sp. 38H-ov]|uniref:hypothetical protein n=1 Tax=Marinitoga sp. 38H-ov TaxID=1755814 RepID=UPI0019D1F940|nr:hypothetical protein [Marinitoga sp. 38H-ov]
MIFAIYIMGISSGVRIWELEKYFGYQYMGENGILLNNAISLTTERWILEIFRTIIEALQGVAIILLIFFIFALIAFVLMRAFETKNEKFKLEKKDI